jgi:hypothetical protein
VCCPVSASNGSRAPQKLPAGRWIRLSRRTQDRGGTRLERVLADEDERDRKHPDRIELPE